ncbi:MAG: hypothetical protein P9L99_16810 [Candidatus Lernaella stagnicola]|nr:hypothetical protein [Candidatus Lernaella stagnicola]
MPSEYKNCLVTFFDILGFSSLVSEEQSAEKIESILEAMRSISQPDPISNLSQKFEEIKGRLEMLKTSKQKIATLEERKKWEKDFAQATSDLNDILKPEDIAKKQMNRMQTINFSDSIVRVVPLFAVSSLFSQVMMVVYEFFVLNRILADLALKKILLRGGITIGAINVGESHVFGPALIKAYRLESRLARYPRIVVDSNVLDLFHSPELAAATHEAGVVIDLNKMIEGQIRKDHDGVWFMDYIEGNRRVTKKEWFAKFIQEHKEAVITRIEEFCSHSQDASIGEKLFWIANYHNSSVDYIEAEEIAKMGVEPSELKIIVPKLNY